MPNCRGPSRGCQRCRRLKVKCDERKPSCQRCHKGSHNCLYQDAFDYLHRDQNIQARTTAIKKWRQRADVKIRVGSPEGPVHSLYQLAYMRFCYDFVAPFSSMVGIPQILPKNSPHSCLCSAVAAVSYANYHRRCNSQEANEASSIHYGRTLQKLASLMTNTAEMQRDEVLMVVLLLGLFEMLTSSIRDGFWMAHMQGAESVLAHRKNNTLNDSYNYDILLCMHLVIYYLQEAKAPPLHFDSWVQQIPSKFAIKKQLIGLMSTTASIRANIRERCSSDSAANSNGLPETDLELLESAQSLDMKLTQWAAGLPPKWALVSQHSITVKRRPRWARELFSIPGAPEYMYIYKHHLAAADWNMYRATRIRLNLAVLELLSKGSFPHIDAPTLKDLCFELLLTLACETAATIPYLIGLTLDGSGDPTTTGEIHGLYAYTGLWPSYTSLFCFMHPLMKDKAYRQRATWFKHILLFLRDTTGISKAQVLLKEEQPRAK